jgi:GrpB-like predicted nucleotidyltransferase (UPF0157 family)
MVDGREGRRSWEEGYPAVPLTPADLSWSGRYAELAGGLTAALGPGWDLEHVGSTSVPGMLAKPVIDIALRMPAGADLRDASVALGAAGWTPPVPVADHLATFLLADDVRSAIGHLFRPEQWPEAHVRLFSQWLRDHPEDRVRYAELKRSLVEQGQWGAGYTDAKGGFVAEVVDRARAARGLPPVAVRVSRRASRP